MARPEHPAAPAPAPADLAALEEIHDRLLWLATSIIHHANRVRPNRSGLKVGGHQASCASIASIMTALWFHELGPEDRVSIKPHAGPVWHAINYLFGDLDETQMTSLRAFGGLQSYPSRTKDPVPADYSTGSVGIGATAPIWGAVARRYVDSGLRPIGTGRQYSLVGDAELDEGAVWEAVNDPGVKHLGEIVWIVDLNRQSLDRIVPDIAAGRIEAMFDAAGWQVITVKFGRLLEELFLQEDGTALRTRILTMSNPEYQRILRCTPAQLRERLPGEGEDAGSLRALIDDLDDDTLLAAIRNLGGHDIPTLLEAFARIDDTRPSVIIAYTIKGHGLPSSGHPQNHSALIDEAEYAQLASRVGQDPQRPWARFVPGTPAERLVTAAARRLKRTDFAPTPAVDLPRDLGRSHKGTSSSQAALGRVLMDLSRQSPETARRVVTVSPDVSSTTNLGGWVNKVGVWSADAARNWFADDSETILQWNESATGQHMELGIAETNLVGLLGELGATWSRWGEPLFPIGVMYDPFVNRALEPWTFGIYAGGQSILVGTPSGVTLAPEGGAHQSITTPSTGLEVPGLITYEPAFAQDVEWTLLHAMAQMGRPGGESAYLRLSTRGVDQSLAAVPADPAARERRRRQAVAGAYRIRSTERTVVRLVGMGALMTEVLAAADRLEELGVLAEVICVTSPGLLYRALQSKQRRAPAGEVGTDSAAEGSWILDQVFPASSTAPLVTVVDGHPHTLSFLATINRVEHVALGVSSFGQSGDIDDVYRHHGIDTDSIVFAALDAVRG
ncbi:MULTISPECIES: pyruvate dehydrogenase [unclassified Brevibacterium]|uniref:transketolase-like TK C-terminal-containing protein n=1 Tax=unclassified Brevibacterium TaxID=2614124 RepID=UPI001E5F12B8|nr:MULTISPECIES: pyruvate dehydrogenase [unclassified Brevibacterium]MDK8436756.1 pyruvate dehydrogenase [Brevibacterium sp. H-BE7]